MQISYVGFEQDEDETIPVNNITGTNTSSSATVNNQRPHMVTALRMYIIDTGDSSSTLEEENHEKPPDGSHRQIPHHQKEWGHIKIQIWQIGM